MNDPEFSEGKGQGFESLRACQHLSNVRPRSYHIATNNVNKRALTPFSQPPLATPSETGEQTILIGPQK
jgi:hypothetical protein